PVRIVQWVTACIEVVRVIEPGSLAQVPVLALPFVLVLETDHEGIHPFLSAQHVHIALYGVAAHRTLVTDRPSAILVTPFGGNQDYTVGTTGTIDRCRRCVLQYLDALDVVRVQ